MTVTYSQFACVGTGFSAIGLGATLQRWYGITDIRFFERHSQLGGTWHVNQYPGCACDVPSALYSFSYEPNPDWSRALPPREELWEYLNKVADKYGLPPRMTFGADVQRCEWIEDRNVWRMHIRDTKSDQVMIHECQFLFAASGLLDTPRKLDVPGTDTFKGPMFHTARWRHDIDLTGKNVVIFGNGCTAAQLVPAIVTKTRHLTQVVRSKHWVVPPVDTTGAEELDRLLKYVPGGMALQRFIVFVAAENALRGFKMTKAAAQFRRVKQAGAERYMRRMAPEKYHDILIPDFEIGCKRRVFDCGYLASLHSDNLTLTNDAVLEIVPDGVRTAKGVIQADVIVLANGFATGSSHLAGIEVIGRGGETLPQHWESFGGAEAYNSSVVSGFPDFFTLLGPNSATGHTSAIMASENSINYALRIIRPVLDGRATAACVKREAEETYVAQIQSDLQNTVFNSGGCRSWYLEKRKDGKLWNSATYPWSQAYFWYRSLFPVWKDWQYTGPSRNSRHGRLTTWTIAGCIVVISALISVIYARRIGVGHGPNLSMLQARAAKLIQQWS